MKKCTPIDNASSSSAAALRSGGTPHSCPQLRGLRYRIFFGKARTSCGGSSRQSKGREGVTLSYVCPHCHRYALEDNIWWFSSGRGKKQCSWWCAACGGQNNWKAPNRVWVIRDCTDRREAKVFRAHAVPQGVCDKMINALKLLANKQKDGDSPLKMLVQGLSREMSAQDNGWAQKVHHGR